MEIAIRIPEPCQEDWNAMHARTEGRHCDRCAHTVLDLTRATDAELVDLVRRDAMPKCARFSKSQLDRVMGAQEEQGPNLLATAAAGAALLFSAPDAAAQHGVQQPKGKMVVAPEQTMNVQLDGVVEKADAPAVPEPATVTVGGVDPLVQRPDGSWVHYIDGVAVEAPLPNVERVEIAFGRMAIVQPAAPAQESTVITGDTLVLRAVEKLKPEDIAPFQSKEIVQVITGGPTNHIGDVAWTNDEVRTITGRVVERIGEPLPFATLVWENGEHAGSTDFEGRFSLRLIPTNPSTGFVVNYIGFQPHAVAIAAKSPVPPCSGESIIGNVVDAAGKPLANSTVAIESLQLSCTTDAEGRFAFDLPDEGLPELLVVKASCGGGPGGSVHIASGSLPQCVLISVDGHGKHAVVQAMDIELGDVIMEEGHYVLGEMVIFETHPKQTVVTRMMRPFRWLGRQLAKPIR